MITATKQNWNRLTVVFLTISILQVIIQYGKPLSGLFLRSLSNRENETKDLLIFK